MNAELFEMMLVAMVGEDDMIRMIDEMLDAREDWGLDDDELAEARTDYADPLN